MNPSAVPTHSITSYQENAENEVYTSWLCVDTS